MASGRLVAERLELLVTFWLTIMLISKHVPKGMHSGERCAHCPAISGTGSRA